jgi:riboflavin kinase/FMN adenylyltransferase
MRIVQDLTSYTPEATAVALGVFDGVHRAHQKILDAAVGVARAERVQSVACTFDPHPMQVLQPDRAPAPIATLDERLEGIARCGIDATVVLPFTPELARVEAEGFVDDVLVRHLRAREVVVGYNHTFGRGARGDPKLLQDLGERHGFRTHVVPPLLMDGVPVSSSAIRTALRDGDLGLAARMLGRPYGIGGEIVAGAGRGRTLGFPTANVRPDRTLLIPTGVYAARLSVGADVHGAVVNVGVRPTFGEDTVVVEAYVLDFHGSLYGLAVRLAFVDRIREERRFPGIDALRAQIEQDVGEARRRLGGRGAIPT